MSNCIKCGAEVRGEAFCPNCGAPQTPPDAGFGVSGSRNAAIGFSERIDAPEVREALKKQRRIVRICFYVLIILPFFGFLIYGAASDKMDVGRGAAYGSIISAIFALAVCISFIKQKLTKSFIGTVTEKRVVVRHSTGRTRGSRTRIKHLVRFECEDGKRRKKDVHMGVFDRLQEGDRVRYLPQFPQPFEKYDKSAGALCMFCGRLNPLTEESCASCHRPLIK